LNYLNQKNMSKKKKILRVKKLVSNFSDLKKLKSKHLIKKDRVALSKKLVLDGKKVKRVVNSTFEKTAKKIGGFEKSTKKYKDIFLILNKDIKNLNSKLLLLRGQTKKVSEEKKRLVKKKNLFQRKVFRLDNLVKLKRKEKREVKKEKLKI
jgi:hypothetical protein